MTLLLESQSQKPFLKFLLILFFLLVVLIGVELGFYFRLKKEKTVQAPILEERKSYEVVFGTDPEGRDFIYEADNEFLFSGVGVKTIYSEGNTDAYKLIGAFHGFEEISGSSDRYLLTYNPLTGERLPRVRIVRDFRKSPEGEPLGTALAVEILDSDTNQYNHHLKKVGSLKEYGWEYLEKVLQKGNTVSISLKRLTDAGKALRDEQGNLIAGWLVWRKKNE